MRSQVSLHQTITFTSELKKIKHQTYTCTSNIENEWGLVIETWVMALINIILTDIWIVYACVHIGKKS